jgi:alcohol dehydrogenase (cytochrome c)
LVVKDKVIVGTSGGDQGVRGFIAAFDVGTGEEAWRFHTIPAPGEPGHETWEACRPDMEHCDPDAWRTGGGAVWLTGSYDPEANLTFWVVGNPGPDYSYYQRPGDNLYASSVVALDADSGELVWYFQFTPGDRYDYDAVQIPVLVDLEAGEASVKACLTASPAAS